MLNFNRGINNQNNIQSNKIISNYKKNTDGGRRSIEEVKQDRINTNYNVEQAKIKFRNEREQREREKNNESVNRFSFNNVDPKKKIDSMNNLRRGNFN